MLWEFAFVFLYLPCCWHMHAQSCPGCSWLVCLLAFLPRYQVVETCMHRAVLGVVDLFALPRLSTSLPSCWDKHSMYNHSDNVHKCCVSRMPEISSIFWCVYKRLALYIYSIPALHVITLSLFLTYLFSESDRIWHKYPRAHTLEKMKINKFRVHTIE